MKRSPVLVFMAMLVSCLFTSSAGAVYSVETGRFLQADPLGLGMPILDGADRFHGQGWFAAAPGFNVRQHYRDGMNHYEFVRGSPLAYADPLGLNTYAETMSVSGLQGMLQSFVGGAASLGTSVGGLGTSVAGLLASGSTWAVSTAASGALVIGYSVDAIVMFAAHADAGASNWFNEYSNWGSGGGGPQYDPHNMTTSESLLARDWGVSVKQVGDAIHKVKKDAMGTGPRRHPDLIVNRRTGDAFIKGTTEYVGNLKDYLGV